MLTHRQLRYFVEIVDAGSFSLAAERLFIAQSALSRQVREMEAALQVRLLERDTRHLEVTAAGHSLYGDARHILAALEQAATKAVHAQRGTEGTLKLLHSSSVPLDTALLAALRTHAHNNPGVIVEVAQASSEQQALEIHEGRADIGLARGPILRRYDGVCYTPLYEERLIVVVPGEHRLSGRTEVALSELKYERFVATPHIERGGLSRRVAELCHEHGFEPQPASVRSRKWAQLSLVQGGFGIAIVPQSMGQMAPHGVHRLALRESECTSSVLALWRHDASVLVKRLVDLLHPSSGASSFRDK